MSVRGRVLALAVVAAIAAIAAIAWIASDPRARSTAKKIVILLEASGPFGVRADDPRPDEILRLDGPGPRLSAAVYRPVGDPRFGIVLLHGNRGSGTDHPLYRLLSRRLADAGALVLALDLRGFGGSDGIPDARPLLPTDLVADAERGMEALAARLPPGLARGVVGHSLGANVAVAVPAVAGWRAVAIEPGTDLGRRVVLPPAPELDAFTDKLNANLHGARQTRETVRALYAGLDAESPDRADVARELLLVQGWEIPEAFRRSIERIRDAHPGTVLLRLDSRDHEFGILALGKRIWYPGPLVDRLVGLVTAFVRDGEPLDGSGEN